MEDAYCNSNQTVVGATSLKYLYDIREWIAPCIETIKYHTSPHIFQFRKDLSGEAKMYYKHWSADAWMPKDGVKLLKVCL